MIQGVDEMAWKYRFIASCLRKIRDGVPTISDGLGVSPFTLHRWTTAASLINSIVDGLWEAWGPPAALVYEALACKFNALLHKTAVDQQPAKNYLLSRIASASESSLQNILDGVVTNLSKTSPPRAPLDTVVFHPAACISGAMSIE